VQNAVREVVRKLKAAGEWDDLDTKLLAGTTDAAKRSFFQESSFKADLEYAATNLSSQKDEISLPLDNLRKRVALATPGSYSDGKFAIVPAAYRPSMANLSLSCRLGQRDLPNHRCGQLRMQPPTGRGLHGKQLPRSSDQLVL
jgi:hypothetical protein